MTDDFNQGDIKLLERGESSYEFRHDRLDSLLSTPYPLHDWLEDTDPKLTMRKVAWDYHGECPLQLYLRDQGVRAEVSKTVAIVRSEAFGAIPFTLPAWARKFVRIVDRASLRWPEWNSTALRIALRAATGNKLTRAANRALLPLYIAKMKALR
jgi:hypothetical protein